MVDGQMPVQSRVKVHDCWDGDGCNTTLLLDIVGEAKTEQILAFNIVCRQVRNSYGWDLNKDGKFSTVSA